MARKRYPPNDRTISQLQRWITYDLAHWEGRNRRFQDDQELYLLTKPENVRASVAEDLVVLNDPKVLVRKTAALIARHPNVIEVPASPGVEPDVAQRIENFLYSWDQAINQRWMAGLHNPYRYDQAFYMILRGWLAERTLLFPEGEDDIDGDPSALWDHQVMDPANVYPHVSGNNIDRVAHVYHAQAGELKFDPFFSDFSKKELRRGQDDEVDDAATVRVLAVYWRDGSDDSGGKGNNPSWWHAVLGGTVSTGSSHSRVDAAQFIKEPTELGYNPWTLTIGKGAAYRQTPWDESETFVKEVGTGILDEGFDTYKYLSRMATKLQELLSLESNPPVTVFLANNQPKQITLRPGSRNFLLQREKLEAHRVGPGVADFRLLWEILQQRADRAGMPPAFYAEFQGQSGFSAATLMSAGKDILFPFVEGINQADARKYALVLKIYRDHGPAKSLPVRMPPDGMGRVMSAEINADDIKRQGVYVMIDRDDMTPQELAQKVNLGLAALREKAISLQTLRKEWLKIKNPDKENLLVLAEQVYLNENVISQLVPIALQDTGQEKLRQVWELVQNPLPPQMPGGQVQVRPGLPSGPGIPSQGAAPITGGNMLTNTRVGQANPAGGELNAMLAAITGGAVGGGGAGGLPPVPGTTSPVQPALPPGRIPF